MSPLLILILYILVVIIVILITINYKVPIYPAVTLALSIGMFLLMLTYYIIGFNDLKGSFYALYLFIIFATIINLIIFPIYVCCISIPKEYVDISITSPNKKINMKVSED